MLRCSTTIWTDCNRFSRLCKPTECALEIGKLDFATLAVKSFLNCKGRTVRKENVPLDTVYCVGGKNKHRTHRARCSNTGGSAPGSVNFLSADPVMHFPTEPAARNYGDPHEMDDDPLIPKNACPTSTTPSQHVQRRYRLVRFQHILYTGSNWSFFLCVLCALCG